MKLKDGLILREVAGQYVIVPTGKRVKDVTGVLYMTKPAAALWDYMQSHDFEKEDLIKLTMERYRRPDQADHGTVYRRHIRPGISRLG